MPHHKMPPAANIMDVVGNTPLVHLPRLYPASKAEYYGKLEALNPGGSIKDRTALSLILDAIRKGDLKSGQTVVESSSGNMAIGLAQTCLYFGLRLIVVVDPMINKHTLKILRAYGAEISQILEPATEGGYLEARLARVKELLEKIPDSFWPDQYGNRKNPQAHLQTMHEIVSSLDGNLDYLFAATSTCGTLMGCAEYIKYHGYSTKIIAVDAVGSVIFNKQAGERKIPGHGASRPSAFLNLDLIHDVIHVNDLDCVNGCKKLLESEALLCGGSSGAVVSAVDKYQHEIKEGATCALILCDRGERYLDTIYNQSWVSENISKEIEISV